MPKFLSIFILTAFGATWLLTCITSIAFYYLFVSNFTIFLKFIFYNYFHSEMYNHKSDHVWLKIFCGSVLLLEKKNSLTWHIRHFIVGPTPLPTSSASYLAPRRANIPNSWRCSVLSWLYCFAFTVPSS